MSGPLPLTLCVITRDAGEEISACLASAPFAGDVVVVDSGSSDDTVEVARARGARVLAQDWLGYGAQKNFAVAQAAHDWVLCLDADERLLPEEANAVVVQTAAGITLRQQRLTVVADVTPDLVENPWLQRVARALAPLRDVSGGDDARWHADGRKQQVCL